MSTWRKLQPWSLLDLRIPLQATRESGKPVDRISLELIYSGGRSLFPHRTSHLTHSDKNSDFDSFAKFFVWFEHISTS
jgi:hypothetical protein